jgi:EAL domain-containing protein (putative c-di-GMP-specific phosphodiesterase class I)
VRVGISHAAVLAWASGRSARLGRLLGYQANSLFELSLRSSRPVIAAALSASLVAITWAAYAGGGDRSGLVILYFLPVILAAIRFGVRVGLVTALAAALLAGGVSLSVVSGEGAGEPPLTSLARLVTLAAVALIVAWFTGHSATSITEQVRDVRTSDRLRKALDAGEIVVHYQPVRSLVTREILGFEALARWQCPGHGLVPPEEFIPAAERTGVIADLDRYVLGAATRQLARWLEDGHSLSVAVNISATHFVEPRLLADVVTAVEEAAIPPSQLHIEVTETAIIHDVPAAAHQINALRAHGVRVSIDDFGAGQSSLSYLHRFEVDTVKIDRSFIAGTVADAKTARLVSGMIRLFSALGAHVVAEGISNAEEYVQLQSLRCTLGQGYYLGHPQAAEDAAALL